MDFKEALAAIKKIDGTTDLASVVEAELERLTNKNYELIGEVRTATQKAKTFESAFNAIAETVGLGSEDLESKLAKAPETVKSLQSQLTESSQKLTAAEERATTAETTLSGLERKATVTQAAAKVGAAAAVLERLLGDRVSDLKIEGDEVKMGDTLLKEFLEADEGLKPFLPALFPTTTPDSKTPEKPETPKLPSGTPDSKTAPTDPVNSYLGKTYKVPELNPKE